MSQIISSEQLLSLIRELLPTKNVIAPVQTDNGQIYFQTLKESDSPLLTEAMKAVNTIKEFFFPRHEVLYTFVRHGNDVDVIDSVPMEKEQVIFGCRPCEAASLPILDPLFAWDYQDRFFQIRREKTTVVTLACREADEHCFCSSVGGSPDNTSGSDVMLYDLGNGSFEVRVLTDKGKSLFAGKTSSSQETGSVCDTPVQKFDVDAVQNWLKDNFKNPFWDEMTYRCVGCGVCTYICPTCHCFDIVDEGSFQKGQRVKNWDSCQSALFTLHASGHNPRETQGQRQRQRIMHKFSVYPEKFDRLLCTGCGNCTRQCRTSLGIRPLLEAIQKKTEEN